MLLPAHNNHWNEALPRPADDTRQRRRGKLVGARVSGDTCGVCFFNQTQLVFADGFTAVREVPLFRHSAGRAKERHQTDFR